MGCATGMVKYLVFLANLIFALAGLALVIVGIVFKLNVKEVTGVLPSDLGIAPILSIIIGIIVFITAFLGCCGAVKESTCMLTSYAVILLTIFIVQVAIAVYLFIQVKDTREFRNTITNNVQKTFDSRFKNPEANETMHVLENFLTCCGVYGPDDYNNFPLPLSCCKRHINNECLKTEVNHDGCAHKLTNELQDKAQLVGGVAIGIAAVEVIGAVFALCLASSIRNTYRRHTYA
ncbi:CD63 antigen [Anoplophora glabripennis]|uniref:Tetraspanin n=1 Tax=Anoplophora glabripennis TaxID=217634 RepID=V5I9N6_ANOGL|nr:CD63 antigen [Anoplophora glabripennis]